MGRKKLGIEEKVDKLMRSLKNVDWNDVCQNFSLSEKFIRDYKDYVSWGYISWSQTPLSEDFLREFKDQVEWMHVCERQSLSEKFIKEMIDYINWNAVSGHSQLSEQFIERYKDKINWNSAFKHQKVSDEFIWKYRNKIGFLLYRSLKDKFDRIFIKFGEPDYVEKKFPRPRLFY